MGQYPRIYNVTAPLGEVISAHFCSPRTNVAAHPPDCRLTTPRRMLDSLLQNFHFSGHTRPVLLCIASRPTVIPLHVHCNRRCTRSRDRKGSIGRWGGFAAFVVMAGLYRNLPYRGLYQPRSSRPLGHISYNFTDWHPNIDRGCRVGWSIASRKCQASSRHQIRRGPRCDYQHRTSRKVAS
jgi:hypothetical protein